MNKVTRSVLKEIVKECMVEIFTESFVGDVDNSLMQENLNRSQQKSANTSTKQRSKRPIRSQNRSQGNVPRPGLDNVSYGNEASQSVHVNESYDRKIDNITNTLTKDPVMAEIFKDTANSTLQQQMQAGSSKGPSVLSSGDPAALRAHNSDPTELFAESASKWATLAFSESVIKR